jgi:hypothetical protein
LTGNIDKKEVLYLVKRQFPEKGRGGRINKQGEDDDPSKSSSMVWNRDDEGRDRLTCVAALTRQDLNDQSRQGRLGPG